MNLFSCDKCHAKLCMIADQQDASEVVTFKIKCPCGHSNIIESIGYPKLAGTDNYYFEFTDEFEITCKRR